MDIELKHHKGSSASVLAWRSHEHVTLTRWRNGNPVANTTYEFDPDEAISVAKLLINYAAECKAPRNEQEAFGAYRETAIEANGPGSAKLFLDWKRDNAPPERAVIAMSLAQANWLLDTVMNAGKWDSEQPMAADIAAMLEDVIVNEHGKD